MIKLSVINQRLKGYMMPIAMILGFIFHSQISFLSWIVPYLIFLMLLLTYIKLPWRDIKFTKMHFLLIFFQVLVSLIVFFIINPFSPILAQGTMICVLAPTATSAPVITEMLKGNVMSLTSYSLISNFTVVLLAPIFFSHIGYHQLPFIDSAFQISQKIIFLLIVPILLALFINKFSPKLRSNLQRNSGISFYLWSMALAVVSGRTLDFVIEKSDSDINVEILLALFSFFICGIQFWLGRKIGNKYNDTVAGGQGLGQKNTVLAIWMTQMYLNPIASIGPGAYVLWQNLVNSWQVWRKRKNLG